MNGYGPPGVFAALCLAPVVSYLLGLLLTEPDRAELLPAGH
jgi:hypothetical protein